jgi:hypothetical protein
MGSVLINYRRGETAGEARALFKELAATGGGDAVFMDVDTIALGRDFRQVIRERLESCDLMLALVGRDWIAAEDPSGRRRLDDPNDFVRFEIEAALRRGIPVTPVLVQGAQMPAAEQLPEAIRDFAFRNAFELSHNTWESDVNELLKRLGLREHEGGHGGDRAWGRRQAAWRRWFWLKTALIATLASGIVGGVLYLFTGQPPASNTATPVKTLSSPVAEEPPRTRQDETKHSADTEGSKGRSEESVDDLGAKLAVGRELVRRGDISRASGGFARALRNTRYYTIVARDNCDSHTLREAILTVPRDELIVLPLPGNSCYRVGWGLYATESEAARARPTVAARFAERRVTLDGRTVSVTATLQ